MDKIDFIWNMLEAAWEEMFKALVEFKKEHKHCNVPKKWPENPQLATWVISQRQNRKKKNRTLSEDRKRRLDEIDFVWSMRNRK